MPTNRFDKGLITDIQKQHFSEDNGSRHGPITTAVAFEMQRLSKKPNRNDFSEKLRLFIGQSKATLIPYSRVYKNIR